MEKYASEAPPRLDGTIKPKTNTHKATAEASCVHRFDSTRDYPEGFKIGIPETCILCIFLGGGEEL